MQIRPEDTLACCWDVKQPTNKQTPHCAANCLNHARSRGRCSIARKPRVTHRASSFTTPKSKSITKLLVLTQLKIASISSFISLAGTVIRWRRGGNQSTSRKPCRAPTPCKNNLTFKPRPRLVCLLVACLLA